MAVKNADSRNLFTLEYSWTHPPWEERPLEFDDRDIKALPKLRGMKGVGGCYSKK